MSVSNPKLANPVKKFINWSGNVKNPNFFYYDKEKEENIYLKTPLFMIPLDELSTIKGFNKEDNTGIYSNEVRNTVKDVLRVRTFKGTDIARGIYKEIKGHIIAGGGKFAKSVYAILITAGENKGKRNYELVNFQFYGSSLGPWIESNIRVDSIQGIKLSIENEIQTVGTTEFYSPIIEKVKIGKQEAQAAVDFDKKLQNYLSQYFDDQKAEIVEEETTTIIDLTEEKTEENIAAEMYIDSEPKKEDDFSDIDDLPF